MKTAILFALLAASGDPIVMKQSAEVELSAPQVSCLADWVNSVWPNVTKAKLSQINCNRRRNGQIHCRAWERWTTDPESHHAADMAGNVDHYETVAADGSSVTFLLKHKRKMLSGAQKLAVGTCAADIFPLKSRG